MQAITRTTYNLTCGAMVTPSQTQHKREREHRAEKVQGRATEAQWRAQRRRWRRRWWPGREKIECPWGGGPIRGGVATGGGRWRSDDSARRPEPEEEEAGAALEGKRGKEASTSTRGARKAHQTGWWMRGAAEEGRRHAIEATRWIHCGGVATGEGGVKEGGVGKE